MLETIFELARNQQWLITVNLILSALLLLWVLRYRFFYQNFRKKAEQHKESIDGLNEGFYRATMEGKFVDINPALAKLNGFESVEEGFEILNSAETKIYVDANKRTEFFDRLRKHGFVKNFESEAFRVKTGEKIWVSENAHIVSEAMGEPATHFEGSVRDITDARQRQELEDRIEKLSDNLPGGLFQMKLLDGEKSFRTSYVSQGFRKLLGLEKDQKFNPAQLTKLIHPQHAERYDASLRHSIKNHVSWNVEFKLARQDEVERWMGIVATPEKLKDGTLIFHGHINDITDRKSAEGKVAYFAYYDPLTGLPNRTFFMHQLSKAISSNDRSGKFGAIIFLDLDNFKVLNDTHGHAKGDELLKLVSRRLTSTVRNNDTVSRFGGDEFVILLDDIGDSDIAARSNACAVAKKIRSNFESGFNLGTVKHISSPSMGVVVFDGKDDDGETLLKNADIAMYEAKKQGRNNFVLFDSDNSSSAINLYILQNQLGKAIENEELTVYFQPQLDQNGAIYGCEALVRWQHPELGLLKPKDFVPLAEQSGVVGELDDYVIRKSLANLNNWQAQRQEETLQISINVSIQKLRQLEFVADLKKYATIHDIPLHFLTLEITEQVMARNIESLSLRMQEIRELGVKISLDKFGTGYSSLSQLSELPYDEVKIDGNLISTLEENATSRSLVEAIIAMSTALGLTTVATHVNSEYQAKFLISKGCKRFQGNNYSEPMPQSEFSNLICDSSPVLLTA